MQHLRPWVQTSVPKKKKDLTRQRRCVDGRKHTEWVWVSLTIREMKAKPPESPPHCCKMVFIKSQKLNVDNDEGLVVLCTVCGNAKMAQLPWKTVWGFFNKLKIELQYSTAIPLLGIYSEGFKWGPPGAISIAMFIVAFIIHHSQDGNKRNAHQWL
jgi:hypothetical protein